MFPAAGKRGRKRNCQLKEQPANEWIDHSHSSTPIFWRNDARRCLVASTAPRLSRIVDFHCLLHLGRVSGDSLFFWQLHFSVLFAGAFWQFAAQLVRSEANLVADLVNFFAGALNSVGAGRISADLLLLSRRVLLGVLA